MTCKWNDLNASSLGQELTYLCTGSEREISYNGYMLNSDTNPPTI